MLRHILLLLSVLLSVSLSAQQQYGSITGTTMAEGSSFDGIQSFTGIGGVVVEVYTESDTLYSTTVNGYFQFRKVPAGQITLRFSHLSYKEVIENIEVKPGTNTEVSVTMQEASQEIEAASVKGEIPILKISGDTLIYNAAAVRTLEGDETIRIVEQLPGVQMSESGISVMGKAISRTYVDGKLIFGSNPMDALQNLLANDVLKIRVYDEYADDNPRNKRRKGDDKRRVFNIETKSKLIQATVGHFLASYGADLNQGGRDNKDRYGIGATANFFSESLLLSANAFFNNINRKSNKISDIIAVKSPKSSYDRSTYVNAEIEKNWNSKKLEYNKTTLRASYTYGNDYTRSENIMQQLYFPTEDYAVRNYSDSSRNIQTARYHAANISFGDIFRFNITHNMRFADDQKDNYRSYASVIDAGAPVGGRTENLDRNKSFFISDNLKYSPNADYSIVFSSDIANSDGTGFRTDTLTSTATRRELNSSSDGLSIKLDAEFNGTIRLSKEKTDRLEYFYAFTWEKSRKQKTTLDMADIGFETIDPTNTYNFTNNYNTHKAGLDLKLAFPDINANLSIKPTFSSTGINRDEYIPREDCYNKRFNTFLPSASFMMHRSMLSRFSIQYMTYAQLPSVEQLRPRLNDTNPYMLIAGNQNLKQSYTHVLLCTYNTMIGKANNNLSIMLNIKKIDNMPAYKRTFFTEATYLSEWGYTAPAQSTLTTYENVNGMWTATADIKWLHPLRKLKSQLTVNPVFNYDDTPSFVNDALNRTKSFAPGLNLGMRTNFSRKIRLTLGTSTSYIYSKNNIGQDDKYFLQVASAKTELTNIFKHFYLNAAYNLSYYKRFGVNGYDVNNQILNIAVGCKIFKRRCDISFTAYDILNRNSGYRTAMYSDYIQNSWIRSFGRFFTFNIAYKFNKSKSGVTNNKIKDGSVKAEP